MEGDTKGVLVKHEEVKKKGEWYLPRKEKGYFGNIKNKGRRRERAKEIERERSVMLYKLGNHQMGIIIFFKFKFKFI